MKPIVFSALTQGAPAGPRRRSSLLLVDLRSAAPMAHDENPEGNHDGFQPLVVLGATAAALETTQRVHGP